MYNVLEPNINHIVSEEMKYLKWNIWLKRKYQQLFYDWLKNIQWPKKITPVNAYSKVQCLS